MSDATHTFMPRRVRFDYADTPTHWVPDDPHTTHVLNVLHLLLPAGERWFVDVYKQALPLIDDEVLARDVRAFIGQEATHARAHAVVLDHLAAQGIDPTPFTKLAEAAVRIVRPREGWSWLPEPIRRGVAHRYLLGQLAGIAAVEHFTSVLGWWIVASRGLDDAGADREMLDLLRWHGAEEVEHRSVAFDTYRAAGGGYLRRCVFMVGVAVAAVPVWYTGTWYLLRRDATVTSKKRASLRRYNQAARLDRLPPLGVVLGAVPRYLAPRFHPSHEGRTEVAVDHLAARSLAA
jgi:predicted metal-dependent hydrolase